MNEKQEIATAIIQAFVLKGVNPDKEFVFAFTNAAISDQFRSCEVMSACYDVGRDSTIRKITYADIYERAEKLRRSRYIDEGDEIIETPAERAERIRWDSLSKEERLLEIREEMKEIYDDRNKLSQM